MDEDFAKYLNDEEKRIMEEQQRELQRKQMMEAAVCTIMQNYPNFDYNNA